MSIMRDMEWLSIIKIEKEKKTMTNKERWEKIKNNEVMKNEKKRLLKIKEKDPELYKELMLFGYRMMKALYGDAE